MHPLSSEQKVWLTVHLRMAQYHSVHSIELAMFIQATWSVTTIISAKGCADRESQIHCLLLCNFDSVRSVHLAFAVSLPYDLSERM